MCTEGGASGPEKREFSYVTTLPIIYKYKVIQYNYLTCALTAKQLNTLLITILVLLIVLVISGYVGSYLYKKLRYAKLLKLA